MPCSSYFNGLSNEWYVEVRLVSSRVLLPRFCPVGWWVQNTQTASLQKDKTHPNECPGFDTKLSDGELLERQ